MSKQMTTWEIQKAWVAVLKKKHMSSLIKKEENMSRK